MTHILHHPSKKKSSGVIEKTQAEDAKKEYFYSKNSYLNKTFNLVAFRFSIRMTNVTMN